MKIKKMAISEDLLFNYGVLGIWTVSNLILIKYLLKKLDDKEKKEDEKEERYIKIIEENTKVKAITLNYLGVKQF